MPPPPGQVTVSALPLRANNVACTIEEATDTLPRAALSLAIRASSCKFVKRGKATAAKIDKMTMTTINSIKVKPFALCICIGPSGWSVVNYSSV